MPAVLHARNDDARLDLLLAGRFGHLGALRMLPHLLAGRDLHRPEVRHRAFQTLRLASDRDLPLAADGEPLPGRRAFEVEARAGALQAVRCRS